MGNVSENFKNFELRFNDYCIQANYRDLAKDPVAERATHYKSPLLEISALHSALLDEALSVVRYTIEPQIPDGDKKYITQAAQEVHSWLIDTSSGPPPVESKHTHSSYGLNRITTIEQGIAILNFSTHVLSPGYPIIIFAYPGIYYTSQANSRVKLKVRHAGNPCGSRDLGDELCRDKFLFELNEDNILTELLKTLIKPGNSEKSLSDVVAEARAIESAKQINKWITDSTKGIDENVLWTGLRLSQMKLRWEPGTCF